jgi:hypothetical protein
VLLVTCNNSLTFSCVIMAMVLPCWLSSVSGPHWCTVDIQDWDVSREKKSELTTKEWHDKSDHSQRPPSWPLLSRSRTGMSWCSAIVHLLTRLAHIWRCNRLGVWVVQWQSEKYCFLGSSSLLSLLWCCSAVGAYATVNLTNFLRHWVKQDYSPSLATTTVHCKYAVTG